MLFFGPHARSTDFGKGSAEASAKTLEMIMTGEAYTTAQILPVCDQLEGVDIDFMIGTWKGGKFDAGKSPDPINW